MKVAVVGPSWPDSFAHNIAAGLKVLGHEPVSFGDLRPRPPGRALSIASETAFRSCALDVRWQNHVVDRILAAAPTVMICTDSRITVEAVRRLRSERIMTAMWFPDTVANIGRLSMLAAPFNVLAFKDRLLVQRLQATYTSHIRYLPEACNPEWHIPPVGVTPRPGPIVVVGNIYPSRLLLLQRLHADGVPLRLYGGGFPRWSSPGDLAALHTGEIVTCERKAEVFRGASAVLNNLHPAEMDGVNARLFEATGSGAAVLVEHRPALDALFDSDEVLVFRTYEELLALALAAAAGQVDAAVVGDRAARRAHTEHRYQDRLETLLGWLS